MPAPAEATEAYDAPDPGAAVQAKAVPEPAAPPAREPEVASDQAAAAVDGKPKRKGWWSLGR